MSTSQRLTEHFLTCPVCFEVFNEPCTLACDHTFCSKCVVSYTKTRPDAVRLKSLPCPFCKRLTRVPDPYTPLGEWAGQMKPSLLLRGLIDSFGPGSKDSSNCNLCREGGETIPATAWCSVCAVLLCDGCCKTHSRIPATRNHDVSNLTGEVKVRRRHKVMCQEHKDECIKFYCKDCKKTLCQSCCIIYHRKCDAVTTLEAMLPEVIIALERRKHKLRKRIYNEEAQLVKRQSQCANIQRTKTSIQSKIRAATQRTIDVVKEKAKQLLNELDVITGKQMGQLKTDMKSGDMAVQIYRQQSQVIDQAINSDSEVDMYVLYNSCEPWTLESGHDIKNKGTGKRVEFVQDADKLKKALEELPLGKIQFNHQRLLDADATPVLSRTIDCGTGDDKEKPSISDVTCISVDDIDTLIVTDYNNSCIKAFFSRNRQFCQSRLGLQIKPWRIVKLEDNTLAVTLPDSRQIATIVASPDLSLVSSITTGKLYLGLAALSPSKLVAGSDTPPSVDILDRSGNVLKSISPVYNGQKIIKFPYFICTTKNGDILVSDNGTKSVICLTLQGDVVFNYTPSGDRALWSTRGITSTDTGDILVVDHMGHKVVQLDESGQYVRDLLTSCDGLSYPWCLHYDERGKMYVRHGSGRIKMFTFK